jgi:NADH:ubiquinone oxidoreductase subunit K
MTVRRVVISVGAGGAVFLGASAIGFEVFGGDFPSVFYVLPIALAATIVAIGGAYFLLTPTSGRPVQSGLSGLAGFGYSFFLLWFIRYAIAATRSHLSFDLIPVVSSVIAVGVAIVAWIYHPVLKGK